MPGNKNLTIEVGPAINIEYSLDAFPISINGCVRLHYSELNDETFKFSYGYAYSIYSAGTIIKYYPIKWDIVPYIALGLFYNFIHTNHSEMANFINGYIVSQKTVEQNISTEITGGLILSAKTPVNLIVEVTQSFNKLDYNLIPSDSDHNTTTRKEKFNFNALFIKLGVRFGL
jgi:hypothetical protein